MNEDRAIVRNWCVMNVLPGDTFIDVGADIGEMSEAVLNLHRAKRIIAIDPEGDFLRDKFQGYPVDVLETLVGDREGMATMFRNPENTALNSIYKREHLQTVEAVKPITTIDAIVKKFSLEAPIVIKVDAEFAEPLIWKGMRMSLHMIRVMCMEYSVTALRDIGIDGKEFLGRVKQAGFQWKYINNDNIEIYR